MVRRCLGPVPWEAEVLFREPSRQNRQNRQNPPWRQCPYMWYIWLHMAEEQQRLKNRIESAELELEFVQGRERALLEMLVRDRLRLLTLTRPEPCAANWDD